MSETDARTALAGVADPELPMLSVVDLGIVERIEVDASGGVRVRIIPTFTGCPAMRAIEADISAALVRAGFTGVVVETVMSAAWTTDRMTVEARAKLRAAGIAPPGRRGHGWREDEPAPACPRCGSTDTHVVSAFGATPCKALHRCEACREPFERFKCV